MATTTDATKRRRPAGSTARGTADSEPDLVGQYLAQIGSTPLLTAAQEVDLSKRIEAGIYAAHLLDEVAAKRRRMSAERRRELALIAADGEVAKDHMVRANLRLVVSVARKLSNRGLPFLDVIQEGNLGLIRAVEKFDYAKGFKFSTYATWWIRQAIQRGLAEQTRTVRLPVHVSETVAKLHRIDRELQRELGRDPSVDEIAAEAELPVEKVVELRRAARDPLSLDTPVGDDGETQIGDLIEDDDAVQAAEVAEHRALLEQLRSTLGTLSDREARIIALRFGLEDGHQHTLQDVADELGVSRERVRQLERHALAELRTPERREPLLDWAS